MSKKPAKGHPFYQEISPISDSSPLVEEIKNTLLALKQKGNFSLQEVEYRLGEDMGITVKFDKGAEPAEIPGLDSLRIAGNFPKKSPEENKANGLSYLDGVVIDDSDHRIGKLELAGRRKQPKKGRPVSTTARDVGICMALTYLVGMCKSADREAKEKVSEIFSVPTDHDNNGFRTLNAAIARGQKTIGGCQLFFTCEDEENNKHLCAIKKISEATLYNADLVITADLWHYPFGDKEAEYLSEETFKVEGHLREFLLERFSHS